MSQWDTVLGALEAQPVHFWVCEVKGEVAGFVAARLHHDRSLGEIHLLAVDPAHQRGGIGGALTSVATGWIKDSGMTLAMVETGADAGHAPARRTYEQAGFTELPVSRYFKRL